MSRSEPRRPSLHLSSTTIPDLTDKITRSEDQYCAAGGFDDVFRCRYASSDGVDEVAVKAFRFSFSVDENKHDEAKSARTIRRELGIWRRLGHPNIVPFLGIAHGFGMQGNVSLVSTWMPNGTLHTFLEVHDDQLVVAHRLKLMLDVANGLHYLHSFPIIHGDLSSSNVLVNRNYNACLTDFGYSSLIGELPQGLSYLKKTNVRPGNLRWAAPEHFLLEEEETEHTTKSDIYSLGSIALLVLSGKHPWSEIRNDAGVVRRLFQGLKPGRPPEREIDDRHWVLIERCWSSIPEERPLAEEVVSSLQQFLSAAEMLGTLGLMAVLSRNSLNCSNSTDGVPPLTVASAHIGNTHSASFLAPDQLLGSDQNISASSLSGGSINDVPSLTIGPVPTDSTDSTSVRAPDQLPGPDQNISANPLGGGSVNDVPPLAGTPTPTGDTQSTPVLAPIQLHGSDQNIAASSVTRSPNPTSSYNQQSQLRAVLPFTSYASNATSVKAEGSPSNRPTLRVALVGITGVGKSTLVNLLVGKKVAKVSNDVDPCTAHTKEYFMVEKDTTYCILDTRGLLGGAKGAPVIRVPRFAWILSDAKRKDEREVKKLLRSQNPSVDLVLLCIDAKEISHRITWEMYNKIYADFGERRLKVAVVVIHTSEAYLYSGWRGICERAAKGVVEWFPQKSLTEVSISEELGDRRVEECRGRILQLISDLCRW